MTSRRHWRDKSRFNLFKSFEWIGYAPPQLRERDGMFFYMETAIKEAAVLYLRAKAFCEKHNSTSVMEIAHVIGDTSTYQKEVCADYVGRELLLETNKRNDEVRRYLAKHGLRLQTVRSVLKNLEDHLRVISQRYWLEHRKLNPSVRMR